MAIPFYLLVQSVGRNLVEIGEIAVQHDPVTTNQVDLLLDTLHWDHGLYHKERG